jgi:hypothetical protein
MLTIIEETVNNKLQDKMSQAKDLLATAALVLFLTLSLAAAALGQSKKSDQPDETTVANNRPAEVITVKSLETAATPVISAPQQLAATSPDTAMTPKGPAPASAGNSWRSRITLYAWFAGLDGNLRVRGTTVPVQQDFGEVFKALEFAFAGRFETFKGRVGFLFDNSYINLGRNINVLLTSRSSEMFVNVTRYDSDINFTEIAAAYRPTVVERGPATGDEGPPIFTIDFIGGARIIYTKQSFKGQTASQAQLTTEASNTFAEPFIGQRLKYSPVRALSLAGKYDIGLASELTWSAEGLIEFHLLRRVSLGAGYRVFELYKGRREGNVGLRAQLRGPILTTSFRF